VSLPLALLLHPWERAPASHRRPSRRASPLGRRHVVPKHAPSLTALTVLIYQLRLAVLIMMLLLARASRRAGCHVPPPRITPDPRRATPLCIRCTTPSRSTLHHTMAVMPFGFVAHRCRCTLPRHAPRPWLLKHARAGYQHCGLEREHPCPGPSTPACLATMERHTRWHLFLNARVSGSPRAAPATACRAALLLAAPTRTHPGAAPRRAGTPRTAPLRVALTPLFVLCSAFAP
jgi:hypothetical protein